jgi:L-threonylcarbamoyladenylate synthase
MSSFISRIQIKLQIEEARALLSDGKLVVIPTETVYGLAANAFSEEAIDEIYKIKNRPTTNPLIVHVYSITELSKIAAKIPKEVYILAKSFCPGPLTFLLEKLPSISHKITAGLNTVAVRIPDHPIALELLSKLDFPLVAPSANRSNHISPTCPEHVSISLGDNTPYILNGGMCTKGIESTIIGFENEVPVIYRLGAIAKEEIEKVLGVSVEVKNNKEHIIAPGMLKKHYSPKTSFIVTDSVTQFVNSNLGKKMGIIVYSKIPPELNNHIVRVLSPNDTMEEAMSNLYKTMYDLDLLGLDIIISELLPNKGLGVSINDRLMRAASD